VAKIELPESWAGVAQPLRALMAELERETQASGATPADFVAVSARWARVSDAIRATLRARIAEATELEQQVGAGGEERARRDGRA
jgi:hypothetical protein